MAAKDFSKCLGFAKKKKEKYPQGHLVRGGDNGGKS